MKSQLERRVNLTYHARLQTAKRLQSRNITWNVMLVTMSVVTTIVATVQLVDPTAYGPRGPVLLVIVGIAALASSLLVTSANFGVRAEVFFRAYRALQRLWVEVDQVDETAVERLAEFETRYQQLLDETPNHSEADFRLAYPPQLAHARSDSPSAATGAVPLPWPRWLAAWIRILGSFAFTNLPILLSAIAALLLIPTVRWLLS